MEVTAWEQKHAALLDVLERRQQSYMRRERQMTIKMNEMERELSRLSGERREQEEQGLGSFGESHQQIV